VRESRPDGGRHAAIARLTWNAVFAHWLAACVELTVLAFRYQGSAALERRDQSRHCGGSLFMAPSRPKSGKPVLTDGNRACTNPRLP